MKKLSFMYEQRSMGNGASEQTDRSTDGCIVDAFEYLWHLLVSWFRPGFFFLYKFIRLACLGIFKEAVTA
jgi:hypothetical protein